ncbi:MAG: hypothetical protein OEZ16_03605 [Chromatiales bacterium]|nr:hypothetical protein [Chromatiales bacterium]
MSSIKYVTTVCLALGVLSAPVFAANGKPFQELQAQIDANLALIQANTGAIAGLTLNIDEINAKIDATDVRITALELDVANNSASIAAALDRITMAEGDIQALYAELSGLAAQHTSDIVAVNLALDAIAIELANLHNLRQALAESLNAQISELSVAVSQNSSDINAATLQLLMVNAQLTSINSSIIDLQNRHATLEKTQSTQAEALAMLESRVTALEGAVDTLFGFHLYTFSGIQTDLAVDNLNGWSECYSTSYADMIAHPEAMEAACTGNKIMLACRPTGSDVLTVAAHANREDVFFVTGDGGNVVHNANGVDWYFSYNYSMGFAPEGEGVMRTSADTQNMGSPLRLSWHTHDHYTGGWRCGSSVGLNYNGAWEKVIYQAD